MLKAALEIQSAIDVRDFTALDADGREVIAFACNQRDEVRDLRDVAGAIQAQPGMKQQTFVAQQPFAFHINQREETIDLHGLSGALLATRNMQMQTFVLNPWDTQQARISVPEGVSPTMAGADGGGGRNPAGLIMAAGFCAGAGSKAQGIGWQEEIAPTLKSGGGNGMPSVICLNDQGGQRMDVYENQTGTLRAQMDGHPPLVFENHGIDSRYTGPHKVAPTVTARYGTGGNNQPLVAQGTETFCLAGNTIDRQPQNGGNGLGCQPDISYTITATDKHAVFSQQRSDEYIENAVASTQSARQYKDATDLVYQQTVGTLVASDRKGPNNQYVNDDKCIIMPTNFIRRLTPLECERLQGFPDYWTDIPNASDSARYKALGNSVAIPCVEHVLRGVSYFLTQGGEADA